jgi:hypothetical protein
MDTRVFDEYLTDPHLELLQQRMATRQYARDVDNFRAGKPSPIVNGMYRLAKFLMSGMDGDAEDNMSEIVDSINTVVRPDRPELITHEILLKP